MKGKWVNELPHVLRTYRTTPRKLTGETPFSMTYGSKAVILLETGFLTLSTSQFNIEENNSLLSASLDLVDKRREVVMIQMAHYQYKFKQGYNKGVKTRLLAPSDLVLRKLVGTAKNPSWGKLGPN